MKNRLQVAKEMLRDDGAMLVQCDDYEQAYVKVLLDEVFGAENFDITLYVQVRFGSKTLNEDNDYQKLIEHIHVYKKPNFKPNKQVVPYSLDKFCWNVVEKSKGTKVSLGGKDVIIFKHGEYDIVKVAANDKALKETWATGSLVNQGGSAAEFFSLYLEKRKPVDGLGTLYKVMDMGTKGDGLGFRYITGPKKDTSTKGKFYSGLPLKKIAAVKSGILNKTVPVQNFFTETDLYNDNFMDMKEAFGNCRTQGAVTFNSGKKPEQLIESIISLTTDESDIVLDYHLGSGTTAAVAHKMNRRYIGVEQMDYIENLVIKRMKTVIEGDQSGISSKYQWQGGGSFTYLELKKHNQIFIEKIEAADDSNALLDIWEQMKEKSFLNYNVDIKKQEEHIDEFKSLSLKEQKEHLCEMLDKNQLYVNLSSLNDKDFICTDEEKQVTQDFYELKK